MGENKFWLSFWLPTIAILGLVISFPAQSCNREEHRHAEEIYRNKTDCLRSCDHPSTERQ